MTEAQVTDLVANAAARGHALTEFEASIYLLARELVAKDPANEDAAKTVEVYSRYLTSGIMNHSFCELMLGVPYTDESLARSKKSRDEFLAATAKP